MPDSVVVALCEGDDDKEVLQQLSKFRLISSFIEVPKKGTGGFGKFGHALASLVSPSAGAGRSAIVARDFDDLQPADLGPWCVRCLKAEISDAEISHEPDGEIAIVKLTRGEWSSRVAVVGVGLPGDQTLVNSYGAKWFAVDDYLLLLAREQQVYESVSEFAEVPHAKAMKKIDEVLALFRANGLEIIKTKRVLQILRGITGFRAGPAAFAARIMPVAHATLGEAAMRALFARLIASLDRAAALLAAE